MSTYTTEITWRIYNNNEGVYIEIGPDADGLGSIEIRNGTTNESIAYFGEFRVPIGSKELCRHLISCLQAAISHIDDGQQP